MSAVRTGNAMTVVAWQGLRLDVPPRWSPLKLEGDFGAGYVLMADLHRPRLGIRWSTPRGRKMDVKKLVMRTLREEVGSLAADEAGPLEMGEQWEESTLYTEPQPPGRDVWVGFSKVSERLVVVIHHAHRRERILRDVVLPGLADVSKEEPRAWSVFDLSCEVPGGMKLAEQKMNAGDLNLRFKGKKGEVEIRQIAMAEIALQRKTLEQWLSGGQREKRKHYRAAGEVEAVAVNRDGVEVSGKRGMMGRRRRFFFAWKLAKQWATYALHDAERDRIVVVQGTEEELVKEVAASVGWAGVQHTEE